MVLATVIVPVFNDVVGLRRCLGGLARQTLPQEQYEVLVVDNGSSRDLSEAMGALPQARLLHEPTPGSYAARNTGVEHARGRVLAFTDADCTPRPDWLERALRHLDGGARDVVLGGRIDVYALDPAHPTWAEEYDLSLAFPQRLYVEQQRYSVTANLITTRRVMSHSGPFNARLKSGGDKEWCQRAVGYGFAIEYADDVVVDHPARHSIHDLVRKRRRQVGGQLAAAKLRYPAAIAYAMLLGKALAPPGVRLLRTMTHEHGNWRDAVRRSSIVLGVSLALGVGSSCELVSQALGSEAKR